MIPVYRTPRDIALKLFREAGRTWKATDLQSMADHLFNFCVTNSSLRDWVMQTKQVQKGDHAFNSAWRAMADGLFGDCADIANASKHLLVLEIRIDASQEAVVAIGFDGQPIDGLLTMKDVYQIRRPGGELVDLTMFFFKTCRAWEDYFQANKDLGGELPSYIEQIVEYR
ncbi:hypothetical protein D9M68_47340 [compost metagenome]